MSTLSTPSSSLVERLAQQISTAAAARTIFGEPIERAGVTVIPVARAHYGLGGGGGSKAAEGEGSGAGAGVSVVPVGYIELTDGRSRFRRIRGSALPVVAMSGLVALLLLRSVPKLLRQPR